MTGPPRWQCSGRVPYPPAAGCQWRLPARTALAARGVAAAWRRAPAGVWVADAKIAACGLHIHRRVATHGFALNVTAASLELFRLIVPCGLAGGAVTAIERHAPAPALAALAA